MLKKINKVEFAIEKVIRFLENDLFREATFFVVQFSIEKLRMTEKDYIFQIIKNSELLFEKKLTYDFINNKVVDIGSHEDPLIETENFYLVCLQVPKELLPILEGNIKIQFLSGNQNIIQEEKIKDLKNIFNRIPYFLSEIINNYKIQSKEKCLLTLHIGDKNGVYKEEEIVLEKGSQFDFKEYLNNAYLGVQCSYDNFFPEIEEKYIIIGQKGMINTHMFFDGKNYHHALLPFKKKYQKLCYQNNVLDNSKDFLVLEKTAGIEIKSIEEFIDYYNKNGLTKVKFMETNIDFVRIQYKKFRTYGFENLFNNNELKKKFHIESELCTNCHFNSKCVQLVPSGLSFELFKKNIMLEDEKKCSIYQLINKVKDL